MNNKTNIILEDRKSDESKMPGCWAKFKKLFEDRGFDLSYEYNNAQSTTALDNQNDCEEYRRIEDGKNSGKENNSHSAQSSKAVQIEERKFYEQIAVSNEETEDSFRNKTSKFRYRVSVRPSMYLTNIIEEIPGLEAEEEDVEEVSKVLYK